MLWRQEVRFYAFGRFFVALALFRLPSWETLRSAEEIPNHERGGGMEGSP